MRKSFLIKHFSAPGKMGLCVNCDHHDCANCSMGTFSDTVHKFAAQQQQISKINPDFRYIRFRAIGNLEVDGPNCNFDGFPYDQFLDSRSGYGYASFINKHAFIEHNSDDISKSIGSLLGAYLNRFDLSAYGNREWEDLSSEERIEVLTNREPEEDGSIEVLMAVDSHLSPSVARMIDTDTEVGCSMGTNIDYSDCSVCGNRARFEYEYCNHVAYSKGATVLIPANQIRNLLKEGKLRPEWIKWVLHREADQKEVLKGNTSRMVTATVFEINFGLSFFELSVVANPAYIRGYKLEKIASLLKKGFQQLLPLVRVDDDEVEVHIDVTNEYFNSSTAKKAKLYGKDFDDWTDLEKVAYLRDGELAKNALSSGQVRKVYVEREHQSKLEKFGAAFTPMENPSFVQLTNPEILLKLTFAAKEDFMKFGDMKMEYKNTKLDLKNVDDFKTLVSQQGIHPQELVDNMYQLAGKDEKEWEKVDDYVKKLQVEYKVVPNKKPLFEKKIIEKDKFKDKGGGVMGVRKKKIASSWTDLTNNFGFSDNMTLEDLDREANNYEGFINDFVKANDLETLKKWIQEELVESLEEGSLAEGISVADVLEVFKKYVHPRLLSRKKKAAPFVKKAQEDEEEDREMLDLALFSLGADLDNLKDIKRKTGKGYEEIIHNWLKGYIPDQFSLSEEEIVQVVGAFRDEYEEEEETPEEKEASKKKAVYDGLPSTAEDITDQGIKIEKTEVKIWDEMSEKGDKMIEKEKKTRLPGVIFLEDVVSAAKVVRDTKNAIQELKKQVTTSIEILSGELPPGLKEYMEKKKLDKGEAGPVGDKPADRPPTDRPPEKRPPEGKPEAKPGEKPEEKPEAGERKPEEKKPTDVKEVLQNAVKDLKEVHEDLKEVEEKLEGNAEKPLAKVLDGKKRYGRRLKTAVEEALKEAKPVIEDAQDAVKDAQEIIENTIKDLKTVEKPGAGERKPEEKDEKLKEKDEGGETVTDKLNDIVSSAGSIKKAHKQLTDIFADKKEATSYPPTGAKDPGDYGRAPVDKELAAWKGFNQEYEKMKGKEKRTEFDTPAGRVDLLTGIVAKLFLNKEKRGDSYWLVTKQGSDFAVKSTFVDVAGENQTDENFKKFCSDFYKLQILKSITASGLDDTRREMFGKWVKVKKQATPFEGREIKEVPKGLYDTDEADKKSGQPRPGVELDDAPKVAGDKKYFTDAFGDSGYAGELTKAKVAKIIEENEKLRKKLTALEADKVADALAKKAVDLARKAAAAGVIPFDVDNVTEKAKEYSELDDVGFKAVEETLDALPVVHSKALEAYQIPEAENVDSGVVYDATDSVHKEKIEGKHPDELKIDNMKPDVEQAAKLSKKEKKADFRETIVRSFEEITPPVRERSRFEEHRPAEEERREEEEVIVPDTVGAAVKDKIRKRAGVVPQVSKDTVDLENVNRIPDFTSRFTTTGNALRKKGIDFKPQVKHYRR